MIKYCGVLPFAREPTSGKLMFLLGREVDIKDWHDSNKWSDFGGKPLEEELLVYEKYGMDHGLKDAAIRECYEETMGMLGCIDYLRTRQLERTCIVNDDGKTIALIYTMPIMYDERLPTYYNRVYNYFKKCAKDHPELKGFKYIPSCPEGYMEKTELKWFTIDDIIDIKKVDLFRPSFLNSFVQISLIK